MRSRTPAGVVFHGLLGWALYWAAMGLLSWLTYLDAALVIGALVTPFIFGGVAYHYFRRAHARAPLGVAVAFAAIMALLDAAVVGGVWHGFELLDSVTAFWVPLAIVFFTTWTTGEIFWATLPAVGPRQVPAGEAQGERGTHAQSGSLRVASARG